MGLIQRAVEAEGIPTVGISILKEVTRKVRPPRSVFLRYPFGHPLGEAFNVAQQRTILLDALRALEMIVEPGTILEPGYPWRKHHFDRATSIRREGTAHAPLL